MSKTADLVLMNILEFFNLSLSGPLHALSLRFDERVVFSLFCLPSSQALFCLSPEIFFSFFQMRDFFIAGFDLTFFATNSLS